ncbi:DUF3696 domain-containing protein [Myxococcota bacterium]|jgi:predicted ATPase|nr:DUF3696 domain-containing protein [Myxococcota bacterium]
MLTQLDLRTFKCFERKCLPLAPLTVLTGLNASGKSTTIQALTLVQQSLSERPADGVLALNGDTVNLGAALDLVHDEVGRRSVGIGVSRGELRVDWSFTAPEDGWLLAMELPLSNARWSGVDLPEREGGPLFTEDELAVTAVAALRQALIGAAYLSAERLGPRETYPLGSAEAHRTVGALGERAPGTLYWHGRREVHPALCLPDTPPTLLRQTDAWLGEFFPGAGMEIERVSRTNLVRLGLRTSARSDFRRPQNVGFGLSNVLPILVAALNASPGDLLLIENPEVHLHPAGQAKIGRLLARVAAATGAQVILETHSDHVLNGVRRAVRERETRPDQVGLLFFRPPQEGLDQVVSPQLDVEGNIDHWPEGFFDQFEKDMSYFAGWGD